MLAGATETAESGRRDHSGAFVWSPIGWNGEKWLWGSTLGSAGSEKNSMAMVGGVFFLFVTCLVLFFLRCWRSWSDGDGFVKCAVAAFIQKKLGRVSTYTI